MIYLTGGAAVPNYGDELIVDTWLRWYIDSGRIPPNKITVNGSWPRVFRRLFQQRYPGLGYSGEMRLARMAYRPSSFSEFATIGYEFLDQPKNRDSPLMRDIEGTTLFHLHGGGYLNSYWPEHAFNAGVGAWAKEQLGTTLVGTGLGFGPLDDVTGAEQDELRRVFAPFDVLEVRDEWSHEYLIRNDLHDAPVSGSDDAFLVPARSAPVAGSVLHVSIFASEMLDSFLSQVPRSFVQSFDRVAFWICTNADATNFATFARTYPETEALTLDQLLAGIPVGTSNHMVTARFHPHLMGVRLGMTGHFASAEPYYDVKHGSLATLGSPFVGTDFSDVSRPIATDSESQFASEVTQRKQQLARSFLPRPQEFKEPRPAIVSRIRRKLGAVKRRYFRTFRT